MEQENVDFLLHKILFDELIKSKDDTSYTALFNKFNKFLSVELTIDTLKSKNFESDFIFLSISDSLSPDDVHKVALMNKNKFIVVVYKPLSYHGLDIYVYRLSGFSRSDFPYFLSALPYFLSALKATNRYDKLSAERMNLRKCEVEGLDLKLLVRTFKKFNVG
ncbi:MAG: hypothetical protein EAZ55_13510 [Cytophagales bacterium]|nr:MAG: hypothetical protein EAZ55_13510 [Cytophagales bacterium]